MRACNCILSGTESCKYCGVKNGTTGISQTTIFTPITYTTIQEHRAMWLRPEQIPKCSACGEYNNRATKFCPNCGCLMDLED